MTRHATHIPALDVAEIDDIPFDFRTDLQAGETIASVAIEVLWLSGDADATPGDLVVGSHAIGDLDASDVFTANASGGVVLQRFQGKQTGTEYTLRCKATTSAGRRLVAAGRLPVLTL